MNAKQSLTLLVWGSLALVTLWKDQQIQTIGLLISGQKLPGQQSISGPQDFLPVGIDLVGVALATFLAGLSDTSGNILIAIGVALWLAHLMGANLSPASKETHATKTA